MDYILLAFSIFFIAKGFCKGFLSTVFSMIGVVVIAIVAWQVKDIALPMLENFCGNWLEDYLKNKINLEIVGKFSSLSQLQSAVANSKFSLFGIFLFKLLGDLSLDGELSAGQILAPSITTLLIKIFAFLLIFIILYILIKILRLILTKIIKKCGLTFADRILGCLLGGVKALAVFAIFYFVMSSLANLTLSNALLDFVQSGVVSKFIYNNFITKIVALFY